MEQYKDEKAFLETLSMPEIYGFTESRETPVDLLAAYKAYLIEQAKKGKLTAEEFIRPHLRKEGRWVNYHEFTDEVTFNRKNLIKIMDNYANQLVPVAPAEQWISVKDRLPENRQYVLSFSPNYNNIAEFKYGLFFEGLEMLYNVTHWMPLPAAPEQTTSTKQP